MKFNTCNCKVECENIKFVSRSKGLSVFPRWVPNGESRVHCAWTWRAAANLMSTQPQWLWWATLITSSTNFVQESSTLADNIGAILCLSRPSKATFPQDTPWSLRHPSERGQALPFPSQCYFWLDCVLFSLSLYHSCLYFYIWKIIGSQCFRGTFESRSHPTDCLQTLADMLAL